MHSKNRNKLLTILVALTCVVACGCDEDEISGDPPAQIAAVKGKKWQLQSLTLRGKKSNPAKGVSASLIFDGSRFTGRGGCNSYEVKFIATPKGAMHAVQISWTEMACLTPGAMQLEKDLNEVLSNFNAYTITAKKLVLANKAGKTEAVFVPFQEPAPAPLEGVTWQLKLFEETEGKGAAATATATSVVRDKEVTLVMKDGKASGTAGCNNFAADVKVAGQSLTFSHFVVTEKGCEEVVMQQEEDFLNQLKKCKKFTIRGNQLSLSGDNEQKVLLFQVAPR